mmetsp:Transcript_8393/g.9362  ORF Transcript_8393/g.9362 Transcript_8393/m.9362 type:complete len:123 (+) Transcript_8393:228-596(+)
MTKDQSIAAVKEIDKDGDGHIDFEEFIAWWRKHDKFHILDNLEKLKRVQEAVKAFRKIDADNSGAIDIHEWNIFWESMVSSSAWTAAEEIKAREAYKEADKDGDGLLQWNEFVDLLVSMGVV